MKRVAITGASGSMGYAAYLELMKHPDQYQITLLVRPSKKNIKLFKKHIPQKSNLKEGVVTEKEGVKIVWGSVTQLNTVRKMVENADIIINMAAIIPPRALDSKKRTDEVNIGGVQNIVTAIQEIEGGSNRIKLITISSVAVYGDRLPPYHMIQVGDPIFPSIGDFYALTKVAAERIVIESGLRYWAVIRQTFITIPNLFSLMDPIMYHQPIDQHIEPITSEDAGFGIVNCIDAPDPFWRNIYNMSGGENFRVVYHEFLNRMFSLFGLNSYKCMQRNWFALRNFHCGWYKIEDSKRLEQYAHHQRDSYDDFFQKVAKRTPSIFKLAKIVPPLFVRCFMRLYAQPLKWVKHPEKYPSFLSAYFGNQLKWKQIPNFSINMPTEMEAKEIEYGYKRKENGKYTLTDMKSLAQFRGGECLSKKFVDLYTPLKWKCHICGEEFEATPMLVTDGGHWCPNCQPPVWRYNEVAKKNPFLAQIYYNRHEKNECELYNTATILQERGCKD